MKCVGDLLRTATLLLHAHHLVVCLESSFTGPSRGGRPTEPAALEPSLLDGTAVPGERLSPLPSLPTVAAHNNKISLLIYRS